MLVFHRGQKSYNDKDEIRSIVQQDGHFIVPTLPGTNQLSFSLPYTEVEQFMRVEVGPGGITNAVVKATRRPSLAFKFVSVDPSLLQYARVSIRYEGVAKDNDVLSLAALGTGYTQFPSGARSFLTIFVCASELVPWPQTPVEPATFVRIIQVGN